MTPERLQQIRLIYERVMELAPSRRDAYLADACAGDEELRREVDSLVETGEHPASLPDAPDSPVKTRPRKAGASRPSSSKASKSSSSKSSSRKGARRKAQGPPEVVPGRTTLGAYRVLEKIGAGGMGTVYLAKDTRLGRRVALKLLPAHFARDEGLVRRFEQEARAASALNHPNILTVHEIGEDAGRLFIVTEFVEGKTLRERMWEGRFSVTDALDVCAQVAGALAKAHAGGIVHRDVKPENVMLDEEGHVKVLDFGIAKQVAASPSVDTEAPTSARVNTASGVVLGTTTYMSPEQVRGQELDGRSDVWSLGCVLYEMLAARAPFEEKNFGDLVVSILHRNPPPLKDLAPEVPDDAAALVARALAKRREDRFESAKEFRDELRRVARLLALRADTPRAAAPPAEGDKVESLGVESPAAAGPPPSPPQRPSVVARKYQTTEQRRQLTVLFADLAEGLAALPEGLDAEDVGELMSTLWPLVDAVVEAHGGEVTKRVGESFVALWGAREAREDDPERAVRAALEMQSALFASVSEGEARGEEGGEARLMRAGVSTGLVLLGEVGATGELTVTGDPVRLASRLQQEAEVGGVLISHDTYRHVRGVFDVLPPETLQTGRRAEPVQFYRVLRAKRRAFRVQTRGVEGVETRMIGRKAELRRLTDTLESVFEDGELQIVTVLADAGLGKSRLLYEFSNWVELLPDVWYVFNARAGESDQGLPYSLVRDLFSFRFEVQDSDTAEVAREKLE
ncbi:MAG TPA: protein kinase, partial [Pyrinomonadaceae bacterium]